MAKISVRREKTPKEKVASAAKDVRDAVQPHAETAAEKIAAAATTAASVVADKAGPVVEDAKTKATPVVQDAIAKATPVVEDAKAKGDELLKEADKRTKKQRAQLVKEARERTEAARKEARKQAKKARKAGRQKAEDLGVVEKKKGHKIRNLLIVTGLAALAGVIVKAVTGKDADPAWTASRDRAAADTQNGARPITPPETTHQHASQQEAHPSGEGDTAQTAPLAAEETTAGDTPTTPDEPYEKKDL